MVSYFWNTVPLLYLNNIIFRVEWRKQFRYRHFCSAVWIAAKWVFWQGRYSKQNGHGGFLIATGTCVDRMIRFYAFGKHDYIVFVYPHNSTISIIVIIWQSRYWSLRGMGVFVVARLARKATLFMNVSHCFIMFYRLSFWLDHCAPLFVCLLSCGRTIETMDTLSNKSTIVVFSDPPWFHDASLIDLLSHPQPHAPVFVSIQLLMQALAIGSQD